MNSPAQPLVIFFYWAHDMRQPSSLSCSLQWTHHGHNLHKTILLSCLYAFSVCRKANKSHFAQTDLNERVKKDDAFIKYGNLLNGPWQSHWRPLFRCRWLPPYWLPLSLMELPVREKGRKLPPASTRWQSITVAFCLNVRLTALLLKSLWLTLFPLLSV